MVKPSIPNPSPLLPPSSSPPSLSERINIATRPIHSQLNKLIVARLPLALPPYTTNPSTYISGLLHITPIYQTFEHAWQCSLDSSRLPTSSCLYPSKGTCADGTPPLNVPTLHIWTTGSLTYASNSSSPAHSILSHLRLPGLLRSERLRADIQILTGFPGQKIETQLQAISHNGKLEEFIAHTRQSVDVNPHVLLAYTWVLYMALFSGGRYIRASLKSAGGLGHDFWRREPSPVRPYSVTSEQTAQGPKLGEPTKEWNDSRNSSKMEDAAPQVTPGMQFFNFSGEQDGEDIKLEFTKRLAEAEPLLSEREKEDIIAEAEIIFKFMIELVGQLDKVMEQDGEVVIQPKPENPTRSRARVLERLSADLIDSKLKKDGYFTRRGEALSWLPYKKSIKHPTARLTVSATILPALLVLAVGVLWHSY